MADERQFAPPPPPSPFVGRRQELEWLGQRLSPRQPRRRGQAFAVVGEAGIGKTALVAEFLQDYGREINTLWFDCSEWTRERPNFGEIFDSRSREIRYRRGVTVVLDGANLLPQLGLSEMYHAIVNWKIVEHVVITSRIQVLVSGQDELVVTRMPELDVEALLRQKMSFSDISETDALRLIGAVNGHPQALSIVAAMASSMSREQLRRVLAGDIYDVNDALAEPNHELARATRPLIISMSDDIIARLKKHPEDVHQLTPRQYEILIADLLRDMGHEVTLTQATRDGGADILATMKTDIGHILCLVDAKKYRADRKIGVGMVRTLHGTLNDIEATSAMLVTTSTYSKEARAMQERHKYQLSLRDYADVASWIQRHGNRLG